MSTISFTCISCRVAFNDADIQRAHYKSDWHRYNLKRKVADLPPVSSDNFQQRVLAQRQQAADLAGDHSGHCSICNKHFQTQNAYENHLKSKRHKELESKETQKLQKEEEKREEKGLVELENKKNIEKSKVDSEVVQKVSEQGATGGLTRKERKQTDDKEDMDEDDDSDAESWDESVIALEECLFCSKVSKSLEKNVEHMSSHGFFIPDVEYVVDLEGLITYLGEKIAMGNICLWCNEKGKSFHSVKSVQQHMIDKGHCKMLAEGDVVMEYADYYDYRSSYPDQPEEGEDMDTEDGDDELVDIGDVLQSADESYELVLPSGATVGHRSLQKYYKQNIPANRSNKSVAVSRVVAHYKAIGWVGVAGAAGKLKMKDLTYGQRIKDRSRLNLKLKANKFQPHLRPQVVF